MAGWTLTPEEIAFVAASDKGGGFRGEDLVDAVAVALAESGGQTAVESPPNDDPWQSIDLGLWQINNHWWRQLLERYTWANPYDNAAMAKQVVAEQGWDAWSTWPDKAADHMARARQAVAAPKEPTPPAGTPGGSGHGQTTTTNPIADAIDGVRTQLGRVAALFDAALWLTKPDNIRRVLVGTAGGAFVLLGIALLGREAVKGATG